MEGDRFHLNGEEAVKLCDENTIGVVAILGSTFDGSYEPVQEISDALDDLQERSGLDIPIHVDGASGAMIAPFLDPNLAWDFRLPRVASINTSGHKYGRVYPEARDASDVRHTVADSECHSPERTLGEAVEQAGHDEQRRGAQEARCKPEDSPALRLAAGGERVQDRL
jgi:hypothetical protein